MRNRLEYSPQAASDDPLTLGAAEAFGKEVQGHDVLHKCHVTLPSLLPLFARLRMNAHLQRSALVAQPHLTRAPYHATAALRAFELRPSSGRHLGGVLGAAIAAADRDAVARLLPRVEGDPPPIHPPSPRELRRVQSRCPFLLPLRRLFRRVKWFEEAARVATQSGGRTRGEAEN